MIASHLLYTDHTLYTHNGLGERLTVDVVGCDTMQVVLDYASGNRILTEKTSTGTVRQGVDEQGQVVSSWLFDSVGSD